MTYSPPRGIVDADLNYASLLGVRSWLKLDPNIRRRFSSECYKQVTYKGLMTQVYASFAGKIFAQFCRIIGTPLALHTGKNIPIEVKVYPNKKLAGLTWDRFYSFPNKAVNRVKSTKCIQKNTGLIEMVGCGFGMKLKVYEKNSAIFFESTQFFWQIGGLKVTIPNILSPGKTIVSQKALNDKEFQFSLEVIHKLLGKVFEQVGIFEEVVG